jgi:hypothetical protein
MKYTTQKPHIGMTIFVSDGSIWRRSDFFETGIIWHDESLGNLVYRELLKPKYYSPLLPKKNITQCRCSFGHEFDGNIPKNGMLKIQGFSPNISLYLPFIEFDFMNQTCLIPNQSLSIQRTLFTSQIHIHPSYKIK